MFSPLEIASAVFALAGEGVLLWILLSLAGEARHLDDAAPARRLWIAAGLIAAAATMRVARYATGTFGRLDTFAGLVFDAVGWSLAWRTLASLPGTRDGARAAGRILVATAVASVVLQLPSGERTVPEALIQLLLSLFLGLVGAFLATLGWRLRAAGETGLVPALATLAGLIAAAIPWIRALVILGAQAGDFALAPTSRLVIASLLALAAFLAWPAAERVAATVAPRAPAA